MGVEGLEVFQPDLGQASRHLHVHVPVDVHAFEIRVVVNQGQLHIEQLGLRHDVLDRLQLGHVITCFVGHLQVGVTQGQAACLVARQGAADAAFAPVVGGQGQMPVVEHAVEFLQVVQRRPGRFEHITPLVAKQVLLEVEVLARRRHELPHARRLGAGDRLRVEGRLDEGQQGQFGGHVAAFEFLHDVVDVAARALGHAHHVIGSGGIPLLAVAHQLAVQIGHGKAASDALPDVGRRRLQTQPAARLEVGGVVRGVAGLGLRGCRLGHRRLLLCVLRERR